MNKDVLNYFKMGRLAKNAFPQSVNARRSHTLVSYFHIENILNETHFQSTKLNSNFLKIFPNHLIYFFPKIDLPFSLTSRNKELGH
jgi:hypothetical protein